MVSIAAEPTTSLAQSPQPPPPFIPSSSSSSTDSPSTPHPRLNLPFPARLALFSVLSFSSGFMLGSSLGGPTAALRYRAENAHRLPTSTPGWYLYHKSKNYHAIVGGTKQGVATGLKMTMWGALFLVVEEAFDLCKGAKDFTSSAGAGLTMAGVFSAVYHRGDLFTSARTAKIALVGGTGFGLAQDLLGWVRGDTPVYVGWLRRRFGRKGEREGGDVVDGAGFVRQGDKI